MVKYLEETLLNKTKGSQSEILFAQWSYDKKIIPSALQAVSNLFPHYSLHDESHSITIINNIVRVLGKDNIEKLSAIDIWLLLEAAYCHDIGMVVSSEKIIKSLSSQEFLNFFRELMSDSKNGLHEFASKFKIEDNTIKHKDDLFSLEIYDGIKFILAEFFRRRHADRSKDIINNPLEEFSLVSPRGAIPPRIFKILGDICSVHTKDFESVMDLSFSEVGIDIEDAHPRFIACLLRIGDLLDLDNNRFSEVMLRTLTKVPVDTLNHKAKHLSIASFRVDREKIEIIANCEDYDTANITQHWFNYLNNEISSQMIAWNNIVPNKNLGYLPTIGNLKVELLNYDYIDGKNKPKFRVDTDKALALLQGAGIYETPYQCIREILQNAVDATLIRIWLEYKDIVAFKTPQSPDFLELTKNYPIVINIDDYGAEGSKIIWRISIKDKGIGISTFDLKYLMNTGSSSKNYKKIDIIEEMPTWMRPSGTFGIGFQSIFMLTDQVTIETKSFFDEQYQKIELNGPNSKKDGDILIQKRKTNHSEKPGSKITIDHRTERKPSRYTLNYNEHNAVNIASIFDPFIHESLDIAIGKIADEIVEFNYKSYFPINLSINGEVINIKSETKKMFDFFDDENSMEITVSTSSSNIRSQISTYYKNQPVDNGFSIRFLALSVNIHQENASEILTLSRNKIKTSSSHSLRTQIFKSAYKVIFNHFDELFVTEEEKSRASMFLTYYKTTGYVGTYNINSFNQWENFKVNTGGGEHTLKELFDSIEAIRIIYDFDATKYEEKYELKNNELIIKLDSGYPHSDITWFILHLARERFSNVTVVRYENRQNKEILVNNGNLDVDLLQILKLINKDLNYSARTMIPCSDKYNDLKLKEDVYEPFIDHYAPSDSIFLPYPKMLSPFVREKSDYDYILKVVLNDKIFKWVYENRYSPTTTPEQIKEAYDLLIKDVNLDAVNFSENNDPR